MPLMSLTSSETMLLLLLKDMEPASQILKNQPQNSKHMLTSSINKHYKNSLNSVNLNQLMILLYNGMMMPQIMIKMVLDLPTDMPVLEKETLDKEW